MLVTGGLDTAISGVATTESFASPYCARWSNGVWSFAASLPTSAGYQTQVPYGNGVLVMGGFTGSLANLATTAQVVFHDGSAAAPTPLATLGIGGASPRAAHTCTPLYDGTFLVYGGGVWPNTVGDGLVYTPR